MRTEREQTDDPRYSRMSRRAFLKYGLAGGLGAVGAGGLGAFLSGCGTGAPAQTPVAGVEVEGDTLVVGLNSDVPPLDPHRTLGWTTMIATLTMGEHLVSEDLLTGTRGTPPLVPVLAESWEVSPDGKEYTFALRKDVKFHDGTPFNADAVEFNIRRQWDKDFEFYFEPAAQTSFWDYQYLDDIQTVDEYTVKLVLSKPWGEFLRMNCQSWGQQFMISPDHVKKVGNDAVGEAPVMTGPYKFVERIPGERIVVERNPEYWGTPGRLAKIIFRPMADVAARVAAVVAGDIDIAQYPIPWDNKADLDAANVRISTCDGPYLIFISLNHKDPVIGNKQVRQAINMAIDREGLCRGLYGDWAVPANSMLPANSPSFDPHFEGYPYDPQRARELLEEAGYGDGFTTQIMISEVYEQIAVWVQRNLRDVGIDLAINKLDFTTFGGKWAAGLESPDGMTMASWGMTADYWIDLVARSTRWPPAGVNNGWYANADVDKLLDEGESAVDFEERKSCYQQVGQILHDDAAFVPVANFKQPTALAANVRGFVRPDEDWFDLRTVYLAK
jgi:peptide/nickel transport system substrate-binding protein